MKWACVVTAALGAASLALVIIANGAQVEGGWLLPFFAAVLLFAYARPVRFWHDGQSENISLDEALFVPMVLLLSPTEMMIAIELEQRYSKKQIFEFYANKVPMGQRGSFSIAGFGEAAQAYFGKDLKNLTLPECALLAAIIQRPSYLSPYKHPERALARRNLVLEGMVETGAISKDEAERAKATALKLAAPNVEASDAPYFVDLVKETLLSRYTEEQLNEDGLRIYSTLDPELQAAAAEAVDEAIKETDAIATKMRTKKLKIGKGKAAQTQTVVTPGPMPQVALIAMKPDTGEVLALVGGRNYGMSQLNHAVAKRPTGSIFKPFVYATAINTALTGQQPVFTAASQVDNTPTAFA